MPKLDFDRKDYFTIKDKLQK